MANRIHNYSPSTERLMHATVRYDGTVRQFRLFRLHVNMATDSKYYPYDIQKPSIKLQSLDYGADVISITSKACFAIEVDRGVHWFEITGFKSDRSAISKTHEKTLNTFNKLHPSQTDVFYTAENATLKNVQDRFFIYSCR